MLDRPTGTLTLLFTDIEGSTRMLQRDPGMYPDVLARHQALMRAAIASGKGVEIKTEGDSFFAVFGSAIDAVAAAVEAQRALHAESWPSGMDVRVRMGLHTGQVDVMDGEYVGLDVHRASRISAAGHGGQVLVSDATQGLVRDALPAGVSLRSLGEHRLRDINTSDRLFQLVIEGLPSEFPPLKTQAGGFNVLPTERTAFIGREDQLAQAIGLLEATRLLTLTGPGGTGKTRLGLALAQRTRGHFSDGVAFVELAPITDESLVASTIRHALSLPEQASEDALETLIAALQDREVLLVLDNFEQVLAAAGVVDRLLDGTKRLKIVVTSRSVLHLTGEQEYPVPPLEIPSAADASDLDRLSQSECVQLFVQRARAADPAFKVTEGNAAAIVEICRRLDGLPLAIELAASRIKLLPPQALLNRLANRLDVLQSTAADRTDRQRTLRGAIDWSYDLLSEPERAVFRRTAIFVGGWTLEAAEHVLPAAGPLDVDTLDAMQRLVDNSLARMQSGPDESRFFLLEVIRDYGLERLRDAGELAATAAAHARLFLDLAQALSPEFTRGEEALNTAEREHDNIRAAVRWAVEAGAVEEAQETTGLLWRFWHLRGHLREGERWTKKVLGLAPGTVTHGRTRALNAHAGLMYWLGDYATARRDYDEMLESARASGDRPSEMEALYSLGFIHGIDNDYDQARSAYRASSDIARELGDRLGEASAVFGVAFTDWLDGRFLEARDGVEVTLPLFRQLGDDYAYYNAVGVLGRAHQSLNELPEARNRALEHLDGAIEIGDRTMTAMALHDLASLAAQGNDAERGLLLDGASQAIVDRNGGGAPPALVGKFMPDELAAEAGMSPEEIRAALARGAALSLDEAVALARQAGQLKDPAAPTA